MANLSNIYITINLSGSVANPINSSSFQVVTPWGKSSVRSSLREAWYDVMDRGGSEHGGVMGNYFSSQTTNGATTTGSLTVFTNANEIGIP
jgi:hypothetical protein